MKTWISTVLALGLFLAAAPCFGEDSQTLAASFQNLAKDFGAQQPWKDGEPSPTQKQTLDQLGQLAIKLMQQPDFATVVPALLNNYRGQDGYPRQKILDAVINNTKYQTSDVPFLRTVFLASLDFTYDYYPERIDLVWHTPTMIRYFLARAILQAQGKPGLFNNLDRVLVDDNPKALLQKYAP